MKKYDYKDFTKEEMKKEIENALNALIDKSFEEIRIENIPSHVFCDMFGCEPDDFNGWQCEWWSDFDYIGTAISVSGNAWYGTISIALGE